MNKSPAFPIKTLIVDDTSLMRRAIQQIIEKDDRIEVVGMAVNGRQCIEKIPSLKPDVITLDIDMPVMNGITTIKHIMVRHQIPIVIVSSLIEDGYFAFEALRLGVVDFIPKPSKVSTTDWGKQEELLRERVLMGACMQVHRMRRVRRRKRPTVPNPLHEGTPPVLVVMGTTLAGPNSVMRIVAGLPYDFPGSIVALQEIHPKILVPFTSCFNDISPLEVIPVTGDTCPLRSGKVYLASMLNGLVVEQNPANSSEFMLRTTELTEFPINQLFDSAAHHFKSHACGVLLTGTGLDGSEGMSSIKAKGGLTVGQEQECCVYPNLVEHAVRKNVLDVLMPDRHLASLLESWAESGTEHARNSILHDTLTGLPNYNLFIDRMDRAIVRAKRHQRKAALLVIDLERFKLINENLGYEVGDTVLKEVAQRLKDCVRVTDTIARIGSDKFVIILEEFESPKDIDLVAQRIAKALKKSFYVNGHECGVGAVMGISIYPSDGTNADVLLKNAHIALEHAPKGENENFSFYHVSMTNGF